jgi:hypothetical protein
MGKEPFGFLPIFFASISIGQALSAPADKLRYELGGCQ